MGNVDLEVNLIGVERAAWLDAKKVWYGKHKEPVTTNKTNLGRPGAEMVLPKVTLAAGDETGEVGNPT